MFAETVNQTLSSFKEDGKFNLKLPEDALKRKTRQNYFKYINQNEKDWNPLDLHMNLSKIQVPKIITVPHTIVEMDYRPYVRSLSPVSRKHDQINQLYSPREQKLKGNKLYAQINQVIKQKTDTLYNTGLLKSPSRKISPQRVKDDVKELLNHQQVQSEFLPDLSVKKIKVFI